MKKKIIVFLFILFLIPFNVFASDGDTEKLYINIDILEDGSINVKELAVLGGDYSGRLRDIEFRNSTAPEFTGKKSDFSGSDIYNGSGYKNLKIYDISGSNFTFNDIFNGNKSVQYQEVESGYNGQRGVYEKTDTTDGFSLKIYNPSSTSTAFYMEYTITDVVVVHNDVAEFAWNVLGSTYNEDINDFEVRVNLPKKDSDLRVWLHGPLNGEIKRKNNTTSISKFDSLGAYNAVSVRMMFDKSQTPNATKLSGVDAKEDILEIEQKLADEANAARNKIRIVNYSVIAITIVWFIALIVLVVLFFIKKKNLEKCDFDMDYLRDFPATYPPETLEYLLKKNISDLSLSASILMIIEKKALKVEANPEDKKDFTLIKQEEFLKDLTEEEALLVEILVDKIGDKKSVTLKQIKKYGKSYSKAKSFVREYEGWLDSCEEKAKAESFYLSKVPYKGIIGLLCVVGFGLTFLNALLETEFFLGYLAFLISFIILIVVLPVKIRTEKGTLDYKKWMALKKFMQDFGTMDEKELPEISIWGKYLVYATILGCADELEKQMHIRMEHMNIDQERLNSYYWYYGYRYNNVNVGSTISNSMHQAVSASRSSIASSSNSSGSGFGGGSVGGGGSFGGGGGGGRF